MRLMSRWIGATHRAPALREVIDEGLIFSLITGLCQTSAFVNRQLTKYAVVSVLAHRMSLHIAASQEWQSLAPSLAPPKHFQEEGMKGIECAQYSAYYSFLRPLRLPFAELRPLLPIVCIVWGMAARTAVLSQPYAPATKDADAAWISSTQKQYTTKTSQIENLLSPAAESTSGNMGRLVSFLEVAAEHLANIQLVD